LKERYNLQYHLLTKFERGTPLGEDTTEAVQRICWFFKTRYNCLPYCGPPLTDPIEIWNDVVRRAFTLGLTPLEFSDYLGISYLELKSHILAGEARVDSLRLVLNQKLHMRIWPASSKTDVSRTEDIALRSRTLRQEWNMSQAEMYDAIGQVVSESTIVQIENHEMRLESGKGIMTAKYAEALGFTVVTREKSEVIFPKTDRKYEVGDGFYTELRRRLAMLELDDVALAKRAGMDTCSLRRFLKKNQTGTTVGKLRNKLEKLAAVVDMELMGADDLPTSPVSLQSTPLASVINPRRQLVLAIVTRLHELQNRLCYSDNTMAILAGVDHMRIKKFFVGDLEWNFLPPLRRLMRRFKIEVDLGEPLQYLPPVPAITDTTTNARAAEILSVRFTATLYLQKEVAEILRCNSTEISSCLAGSRSAGSPPMRTARHF
jgi:DNA-binding XRE family transcriptional regulator